MALIESDPVSLEIMWARLITVVEEMWQTICRTAFSLIVSEAQDFACDLLDPDGESLAHSPRAMPVFNLTLPNAVKPSWQNFPPTPCSPATSWSPTTPGSAPAICSTSPSSPRSSATAAWSR